MRLSVHPYRLALTAPLTLAGTRHAERTGALLRLETDDGHVGWGDAAPLPGFSAETAEDAARELHDLAAWAEHHPFARHDDPALGGLGLLPSARYALELALLDLHAQRESQTLAEALAPSPAAHVPVNALLASSDDVLADAASRVAEGYETLKVKVGRQPVEDDAALLLALRERFPAVALRADANRAWSENGARRFTERVRGVDLEYVEEPLADAAGLEALHADTDLPIALDESLLDGRWDDAVPPWATAVVLKPTFLGGLARAMDLAREAESVGARAVWSSAFESGVGVRGLVACAAATDAAPAGLDPYRRLGADVLHPRLPLNGPLIDTASLLQTEREVRTERP